MSSYHILEADGEGKRIRVIAHIPVPDEQNVAGKALSQCILEDESQPKVSVLPSIDPTEETALQLGQLVERSYFFQTHPDISNQDKASRLDALYTNSVSRIQNEIRQRYKFWGLERSP